MKKAILLFFLLIGLPALAQVKGWVKTKNGEPIPFASIVVANTYNSTSSNEDGSYTLNLTQKGYATIIFQSIGYKTREITVDITSFPHTLNVTLEDEQFMLNEVVISNTENPADVIIRNAIKNRKTNGDKISGFRS